MAMTRAAARAHLLEEFSRMPDEAFGWLVLACAPAAMMHGAHAQIWPDGIGGFQDASRVSIQSVRVFAADYIDANE